MITKSKNLLYFFLASLLLTVILLLFLSVTQTSIFEKISFNKNQEKTSSLKHLGGDLEPISVLYVLDQDVGIKMLPSTMVHFRSIPFFDTKVVTDLNGFTGRNYPLKTKNYRIAILGDSFVESYGVLDKDRFTQQTERMVYEKTNGKSKIEFMGFGVAGWGTAHAYGAIKKYVLKYNPDEIWLTFAPTNDFGDNTPFMNAYPIGPTFIYESPDSNKIIDIKFGYPDIPFALDKERDRRYNNKTLASIWANWTNGLLPYFWSTDNNPLWDLIEDHTFQSLRLIKELCDQNEIKVRMVYRASGYDVNMGNFLQLKANATKHIGREIVMDQNIGVTKFKRKVKAIGYDFINTVKIKKIGILTKTDELEVAKHKATAEFFSDIIIERISNVSKNM